VRFHQIGALVCVVGACNSKGTQPRGATTAPTAASASTESKTQPDAVSATARFLPLRAPETVHALEAAGKLLAPPNTRAELTMPLPSSVLRVRVAEGQRVERGQVLVELAVPEAARAAGQLEGARLRGDAYRARLQHLEALRTEGLARGAELADARSRLAEAQAAEHEALGMLQTVESAGLRRHGQRYDVISPLAGIVVEIDAPLGSMRGPSDGPLVKISGGAPTRV
jgi:multidrug efflux pump subunit AcrA (membrane-fusion protein)